MRKRFLSALLILSLLVGINAFLSVEVNANGKILFGDIDNNGIVTVSDARTILRYATGLISLSPSEEILADIDGDGSVTMSDARQTLKIAARIENSQLLEFSDWEIKIEPTCISYGEAVSYCLTDNNRVRTKILPLSDHIIVPATCTQGAVCSICNEIFSDPIEHNIVEATCITGKYCTVCKQEFGQPLGHSVISATCTQGSYCSICNEVFSQPIGHSIIEATCIRGDYCTVCKQVLSAPAPHTLVPATCTKCEYCSVCNEIFSDKIEHSIVEATCTNGAYCSVCGYILSAPDDHTYVEATCLRGKYCSKCNQEFSEPAEHSIVKATCIMGEYCSECGEIFSEPTGHPVVEATCTDGEYCSVCKQVFREPLGHSIINATCTQGAYCSTCSEVFSQPMEHNIIEATCTKGAYCDMCYQQFSDPSPHTEVPATCTEKSYCAVCKTVLSDELGCNLVDGICERCGFNENEYQRIYISKGSIKFGAMTTELINNFGTPTEILENVADDISVKYYVYAEDYLSLTIFTCNEEMGVIGVYSVDPEFKIRVSEDISFDNVESFNVIDEVYFDEYVDELSDGKVYAFYATTEYNTRFMVSSNSNNRTNEKINFHLVNACRLKNGREALEYSSAVAEVALSHSADMGERNYYSHNSPEGVSSAERLSAAGIPWECCGENIAVGFFSVYDLNNAWYNSEGHRMNMLAPGYKAIGIGIYYKSGSEWTYYGTQNFIG